MGNGIVFLRFWQEKHNCRIQYSIYEQSKEGCHNSKLGDNYFGSIDCLLRMHEMNLSVSFSFNCFVPKHCDTTKTRILWDWQHHWNHLWLQYFVVVEYCCWGSFYVFLNNRSWTNIYSLYIDLCAFRVLWLQVHVHRRPKRCYEFNARSTIEIQLV